MNIFRTNIFLNQLSSLCKWHQNNSKDAWTWASYMRQLLCSRQCLKNNHTLCAEPKFHYNCGKKTGLQSAHRGGYQLCKTESAFSCPHLKIEVWECLWASMWIYECSEGVCVQDTKHSLGPQPAIGGVLEAGKGTGSPCLPTPPAVLLEIGKS